MNKSEIMVGLDSLRYDLEQWKLSKRNTDYYDEVLADAALVVLTTCEHICTHCEAEIEYAE
jgi:hypothetical protein